MYRRATVVRYTYRIGHSLFRLVMRHLLYALNRTEPTRAPYQFARHVEVEVRCAPFDRRRTPKLAAKSRISDDVSIAQGGHVALLLFMSG